jgi:cysteine-rich repeat protein
LTTCLFATCGDGVKAPTESCDDGNAVDNDGCANDCTLPTCGDGDVDTAVACANVVELNAAPGGNNDGTCNAGELCTCSGCPGAATENNGAMGGDNDSVCESGETCACAAEACDDGNATNTDACSNKCTVAACGDGIVQPNGATGAGTDDEQCDDANLVNTDSCTAGCRWNTCGDGVRYLTATITGGSGNPNALEECDSGALYTTGPAGLTTEQRNDGFTDESFFCGTTGMTACQIQCSGSGTRGGPWKDGDSCVFVAEAAGELGNATGTYTSYQQNWTNARQACVNYGIGADLAVIESSDDNDELEAYVQDVGQSRYWIGLRDNVTEGQFVWLDRTAPVGTGFTNFVMNGAGGANEDCVTYDGQDEVGVGNELGQWRGEACGTSYAVVCEFEL